MTRYLFSLFFLLVCYSIVFSANMPAVIGNLTASQGITAKDNRFTANDEISVKYNLSVKMPVTISIYYAQPLGIGRSWYAHPSTLCASFSAIAEKAGEQQFNFKLADIKPPIPPLPFAHGKVKPGGAGDLPGNYVIEVRSGEIFSLLTTHLYAANEILSTNRAIAGYFMGAIRDSKGDILFADRGAWRGRRYSPDWKLAETYPNASLGQSSDPVECFDVAVDSKRCHLPGNGKWPL